MIDNKEFNKSGEYQAEIQEKIHELKMLCKKHNIPFFFASCTENSRTDSTYVLEMLSPEICQTKLSKNWISKFVDITLGFDAVPPEKPIEFNSDMF